MKRFQSSAAEGDGLNVERAGAGLPAGRICPTAKPYSLDPNAERADVIPVEKWTQGMSRIAAYAAFLGVELMNVGVGVTFVRTANNFVACCGAGRLDFNVQRLGYRWFERRATADLDELLIHEFGHLSDEYHEGLCRLGARLKRLASEKPDEVRSYTKE